MTKHLSVKLDQVKSFLRKKGWRSYSRHFFDKPHLRTVWLPAMECPGFQEKDLLKLETLISISKLENFGSVSEFIDVLKREGKKKI